MFKNKSAAGGVASTLIMFIAIVGISTGVVLSFKGYIDSTQSSFAFQNELTVSKLKTALSVTFVNYDSDTDTLYIYVKNIGETRLRPTNFDLFVNQVFYSDFEVFYADNLSNPMTLFSPQDTLVIVKDNVVLDSGTHEVRVVTDLGVGVRESFNH